MRPKKRLKIRSRKIPKMTKNYYIIYKFLCSEGQIGFDFISDTASPYHNIFECSRRVQEMKLNPFICHIEVIDNYYGADHNILHVWKREES